jgi:hypothetical protein
MVFCTAEDLGGSNVATSKYTGIAFVGAVLAGCALGLAATAQADNCDPFLLSMTPQPVLACQAPPADQPAVAPVNDIAPPLPAEVPPPLPLPDGSVG